MLTQHPNEAQLQIHWKTFRFKKLVRPKSQTFFQTQEKQD